MESNPISRWVAVPEPLTFGSVLYNLLGLQFHATFAATLFFLLQAITIASVGNHHSADDLAGFSLALSICVYIGVSVLWGAATALDTLISQAYGRNPSSSEIPAAFLRGLVVTSIIMAPIIVFFQTCEPILISFAGATVGKIAARVLQWALPFNIILTISTIIQRSLIAMRLANIVLAANVTAIVVCAASNYLLTPHGVEYAIVALSLANAAATVVMAVGAMLHPQSSFRNAEWPTFWEALNWKEVKHFTWLALVGLIALVGERWAFLSLMVLASALPSPTLAALGICLNIITVASPLGTGLAAGAMCGNSVGADNVPLARAYLRLSLLDTTVLTAIVATCIYTLSGPIFRLYVKDPELLALLESCKFALCLFHIGDAYRTVLYFLFRGLGQNAVAPVIVIVGLWLVGVPGAWYVSHHSDIPLQGVLLGFSMGFIVELALLFFDMRFRWNWEMMKRSARVDHSAHAHKSNPKDHNHPSAARDESEPLL